MPLYIRKAIKVAPGVRLNIAKSGLGVSVGPRGLKVSHGPHGPQINAGRGGLYYRKTLSTRRRRPAAPPMTLGLLSWQVLMALAVVLVLIGLLSQL